MKRKAILIAIGLLVLVALGCSTCSDLIGGGGGGGGSGNVTLVNNSGETVCFVYISPVTDDMWGDDWLGAVETISSGSSRSFDVPGGQNYDMRADDCDHNELSVVWDVNISGGYTWNVP
jgi:hypothetical protein